MSVFQSHTTTEQEDNHSNFLRSASRESFRNALGGQDGRGSRGSLGPTLADISIGCPQRGTPPTVFQLTGAPPGESDVGYYNRAYSRDSLETNLDGSSQPKYVDAMAVPPGTYQTAHALSKQQPGLAGMGALSALPYGMPILKPLNTFNTNSPGRSESTLNDLNNPNPNPPKPNTGDPLLGNVNSQRPPADHRTPGAPHSVPEEMWEFPREKVYLRQRIGDGLYGEVWRARAEGILGRHGQVVVAIKMLKGK